jgi:hypothetical protein
MKMAAYRWLSLCLLVLVATCHAVNFNDELTREADVGTSDGQLIPFGFYNATTGLVAVYALVYELVIRVDFGVSGEGGEVQMFFNHPF